MEINFRQLQLKRVIVHCGLTKTGSTALQMQLFENREALLASGYCVPKTGIHFDNRMAGIQRTDGHGFIFSPNGTEQDWAELREELSALQLQEYTLVLSCENMAQASIENFHAICDRFLGSRVEFHFLVREFSSWFPSQVSECAIGGNTRLVPDDRRLLNDTRHGIPHLLERLVALEQSGLNVCFHSYAQLKGADIAIDFLRRTGEGVETKPQFAKANTRTTHHNRLAHNNRFVLLAMQFNQRTRNLRFTEYQVGYARLLEYAGQAFYRVGSEQSLALSEEFTEELDQLILASLNSEIERSVAMALLFPNGIPDMPPPARYDVGELVKINTDLDLILRGTPVERPETPFRLSSLRLSPITDWPKSLFWSTTRATVRALRRTNRGTKFVLWLRDFDWLSRLYGR